MMYFKQISEWNIIQSVTIPNENYQAVFYRRDTLLFYSAISSAGVLAKIQGTSDSESAEQFKTV